MSDIKTNTRLQEQLRKETEESATQRQQGFLSNAKQLHDIILKQEIPFKDDEIEVFFNNLASLDNNNEELEVILETIGKKKEKLFDEKIFNNHQQNIENIINKSEYKQIIYDKFNDIDLPIKVGATVQQEGLTNLKIKSQQSNAIVDDLEVQNISNEEQKLVDSPEPTQQDKNKGHYEEEESGFLPWGFILCCCVLAAPLGGGFAFLLTPAQFASFGMIPFWKRGKEKVWKPDKTNPDDRLVSELNGDREIYEKGESDNILTQNAINFKEVFYKLIGKLPVDKQQNIKNLSNYFEKLPQDQQKQVVGGLMALSTAMRTIASFKDINNEQVQQMLSSTILQNNGEDVLNLLNGSNIAKNMEALTTAENEESKNEAAKKLIEDLQKAVQGTSLESTISELIGKNSNETIEKLAKSQEKINELITKQGSMQSTNPLGVVENMKRAQNKPTSSISKPTTGKSVAL